MNQNLARTIIYVHGIGNKPPPDTLKCQWDEALFGFDVGERSRLAYWVNRSFYPKPLSLNCKSPDITQTSNGAEMPSSRFSTESIKSEDISTPEGLGESEKKSMIRLRDEILSRKQNGAEGTIRAKDFKARVLPLPLPLRNLLTRRLTRTFLQDVHEYFFVQERREAMRQSLLQRLNSGGGPFIVIGHSQGSIIAYDVLRSLAPDACDIRLFITIGSPLGLTEVKDQLKRLTPMPLAVPSVVKRWVNVADLLDIVAADKGLANEYAPNNSVEIEDSIEINTESPFEPHSGSGYLRTAKVRNVVRGAIQRELFQRVAPFTIARDLVRNLENSTEGDRHPVLVELRGETSDGPLKPLEKIRKSVATWIECETAKVPKSEVDLDVLRNYVSANLTRAEVERLSTELRTTAVYRVFNNNVKRALLKESINLLQARTAHRGYDATGRGITWAVLDSGIDAEHPHFNRWRNILQIYDCLKSGPVVIPSQQNPQAGQDLNGHGTHVAGIIAGENSKWGISSIAPECKLLIYKVLDDEGRGSDAKILKALDHIYETNANSSQLVIHGINLSLGGAFDPVVFGCGDTPICRQLRQLWRQGVVVVLAAGNEGYRQLDVLDGSIGVNFGESIGDPANLDEAIAVGSVHKRNPHTYGISYFSSRGPTADGRAKPDLVAPGEQIVSCRAATFHSANAKFEDLYVAMSGTSMAAPHISGIIADFLSTHTEFIGYPEKTKQHLLACCTDLKRDRMHQGAGLGNALRMVMEI